MNPLIPLAAVVIGLIRPALLFVEVGPHLLNSYEAFAHLYVGGVFVAWRAELRFAAIYKVIFWGLCAVEVVCAALKVASQHA